MQSNVPFNNIEYTANPTTINSGTLRSDQNEGEIKANPGVSLPSHTTEKANIGHASKNGTRNFRFAPKVMPRMSRMMAESMANVLTRSKRLVFSLSLSTSSPLSPDVWNEEERDDGAWY